MLFWDSTPLDEGFDIHTNIQICPVTKNDDDCGCMAAQCEGEFQDAAQCSSCGIHVSLDHIDEHYENCRDSQLDELGY